MPPVSGFDAATSRVRLEYVNVLDWPPPQREATGSALAHVPTCWTLVRSPRVSYHPFSRCEASSFSSELGYRPVTALISPHRGYSRAAEINYQTELDTIDERVGTVQKRR